ncbi:MAG: helix-turn-helix domain-containing protein [Roseiflexaceae bacterium]
MHDESFGQHLRRLRRAHDLTQEALAELAHCAVDTLRAIENGRRRPSRELTTILADRLQVPAEERQAFLHRARAIHAPASSQPTTLAAPERPVAPAPRSPSSPSQFMPSALLIGRSHELELLTQQLNDPACHLLTLTGPGGVGKTSLAQSLADRVAARFPDGVARVMLVGVQHPAEAVNAVAQTIGVHHDGGQAATAQVVAALATRQQLLMLDNLEQLLDSPELIQLITTIIASAPGIRLLVTSRERLRLRDEWVYELGGLAITADSAASDAVLLFVERARRIQRDFVLNAANAATISRICQLVEGMPLAIELAASWLPTLSPAEIAAELERNLDLLNSDTRDLPERHRSMRTVFEGSWRLLNAEEQRLLARLSLFRSGFTREAAEFVAAARLPQLAALVQKSFVRRQGDRYTLHELIRQFCAEQLAQNGESAASHQRFIDYYRSLAASSVAAFSAHGRAVLLKQLVAEADNLRVALKQSFARGDSVAGASLCLSMYLYWSISGLVQEGITWVNLFLSMPGLMPQSRGHLLSIAVPLLQRIGQWEQALALIDEALELVGDDHGARSIAHFGAGLAAIDQGSFDLARQHLQASLAIEQQQPHLSIGAATIAIIGLSYFCEGRAEQARPLFIEARMHAQREGGEYVLAYTTYCLEVLDLLEGTPIHANRLREMLLICYQENYSVMVATCLEALAAQAGIHGDHQRAGLLHGAAEQLRSTYHIIVTPGVRPIYERLAAIARGQLSSTEWNGACARGRQLSSAEAVALAQATYEREHGQRG